MTAYPNTIIINIKEIIHYSVHNIKCTNLPEIMNTLQITIFEINF